MNLSKLDNNAKVGSIKQMVDRIFIVFYREGTPQQNETYLPLKICHNSIYSEG